MLLPLIDGYRYTARDTLPDREQRLSQPIPYALVNFVVSAPEWFNTDIKQPGEHTYTFVFRPTKYYVGLAISLLTAAVMVGILLVESPFWPRRRET